MRKLMKNFLLTIITSVIMGLYFLPIFSYAFADNIKYVALGDSIAYGYGLENRDSDSYASKVKEKYNIEDSNFQNLAISGMTCQEFFSKIQEEKYKNSIESADLITISIGSNELLRIVGQAISSVTGISSDDPDLTEKAQQKFLEAGVIEKYNMLTSIYNFFTSEETKEVIENAINTYNEYWIKSIKYIKQLNQNVEIVATEFYNPYYEIALLQYDLGGFVDEYIVKMNKILHQESNSEKEYKIAKIYSAFNTTNPRVTNVNIDFSAFNLDPHPNKLGHEIISTKIIDELTKVDVDTKKDISTLTINDLNDQLYTGREIKPEIIIKDGNYKLVENKDYTVSYTNNIKIGKANVIIIGIGNYKGKVEKTFNIREQNEPKENIENFSIEKVKNQTYLGSQITPKVMIKKENVQLQENTDYELKYKDNINVGKATIIITGIGDYTGTQNVNFEIVAKDINETEIQDIPDQKYTGDEISPELVVLNASIKLVEGKDYISKYKNNINKGEAEVEIIGKGNYTGTVTKKFNIIDDKAQKKSIEDLEITDIETKTYTGKLITPEVRIIDNEKVLIKNKDYKISYKNNINVGTGNALITGIGDYNGKVEKTFKIVKKDINYTNIKDIKDQEYTGKELEPEVIIFNDEVILEKNKDYTIEYINNKNEGTASIKIKGVGNYTGEATKTFNIISNNNRKENENSTVNDKDERRDKTIADKILPNTGKKIFLYFLISVVITGTVFYIKLKKYKKLKI